MTFAGGLVVFDSAARLTSDDTDATRDVYAFDPATCSLENLSGSFTDSASDPTVSDDGRWIAFEAGEPSVLVLLDQETGETFDLGTGHDPAISGMDRNSCS